MPKSPEMIFRDDVKACKGNFECNKQAAKKLSRSTVFKNRVWPWQNYDWDYAQVITNTMSPEALGITEDPTWAALFKNAVGVTKLGLQMSMNPNPPSGAIAGKTDTLNCMDFSMNSCKVPKSIQDNCKVFFTVGQTVNARWKGRRKYYPGKITAAHTNGTYDIFYTDGSNDTEKNISIDLIRPRGSIGSNRSVNPKIPECAKKCVDKYLNVCNKTNEIKKSYKDIKPVYPNMKKQTGKKSSSYYIQTGSCETKIKKKSECESQKYKWVGDTCWAPKYSLVNNEGYLGSIPSIFKDIVDMNPFAIRNVYKGNDIPSFKMYPCGETEFFSVPSSNSNPNIISLSIILGISITLFILNCNKLAGMEWVGVAIFPFLTIIFYYLGQIGGFNAITFPFGFGLVVYCVYLAYKYWIGDIGGVSGE